MSRLKLDIVRIILFSVVFCFACGQQSRAAAEPNKTSSPQSKPGQSEQDKAKILREVGQNWIAVGISQYKKGLYPEAEKSFLAASEYQEYLTAEENKQLEKRLTEAHKSFIERQAALKHVKEAKNLLTRNEPIEARVHYEKVRNSPYLTKQELKEIAGELKRLDADLEKKKKEVTELYNKSVALYKAGKLEKARDGFVEVAKYGLFVAPKGQSAEDYLIKIDSVLTEQLKRASSAATPAIEDKNTPPVQTGPEQQPAEKKQAAEPQPQNLPEEIAEVAAAAEPTAQNPAEAAPVEENQDARIKIIRSYTKAVIDDTSVKVGYCIGRGELDKAVNAVRIASDVVRENRSIIGDELFTQYTVRLTQLIDRIIKARKSS